jgi:hypothetical protein
MGQRHRRKTREDLETNKQEELESITAAELSFHRKQMRAMHIANNWFQHLMEQYGLNPMLLEYVSEDGIIVRHKVTENEDGTADSEDKMMTKLVDPTAFDDSVVPDAVVTKIREDKSKNGEDDIRVTGEELKQYLEDYKNESS